jgi:CheY-like chemotaxis protein
MCSPTTPRASIDVLIAEDDPVIRLAVRQLLEDEGYTCAEAEDGRDVLDIALQYPPRLVLLDLMMPEIDGFTAAEELRSNPLTHDVPIHCLTALDFPAARRAAERSGCDVFLTKPFDVDGFWTLSAPSCMAVLINLERWRIRFCRARLCCPF